MAVLAIHLSEHARHWLSNILILLNLCLVMTSLILVLIGIVLSVLFGQRKDMLKDFGYEKHTSFIIISGIILIIIHLAGVKICHDCADVKSRIRVLKFMLAYMVLLFGAFVLLVIMSMSCSVAIHHLQKGFEKGFMKIMHSYGSDKEKRKNIDIIQVTHKCCGSTSYKDWLEIPWLDEKYIRPELMSKKARGVPFTCCDPAFMGPCLHDSGENQRPGYKMQKKGESFYRDGCSEAITVSVRWLMGWLGLWLCVPILLELVTLLLTKYLHSSAQNAIDNNDDEGKGYGFLMEKCPFACCDFLDCDIYAMQMRAKKMDQDTSEDTKKNNLKRPKTNLKDPPKKRKKTSSKKKKRRSKKKKAAAEDESETSGSSDESDEKNMYVFISRTAKVSEYPKTKDKFSKEQEISSKRKENYLARDQKYPKIKQSLVKNQESTKREFKFSARDGSSSRIQKSPESYEESPIKPKSPEIGEIFPKKERLISKKAQKTSKKKSRRKQKKNHNKQFSKII